MIDKQLTIVVVELLKKNDLDPILEDSQKMIESNDSIIAVGPKYGNDLLAYYAASDCFVFPSYREGFPNTVMAAGAMGLPSIVTNINGSREIIIDGENCYIIQPHSSDELYVAMIKMIEDKASTDKMAFNARPMIESRYDQSYIRKCLFEYYDKLLG